MPLSLSISRKSVTVLPVSTLPALLITPALSNIRSVRVVLPPSTCARIPMFRILFKYLQKVNQNFEFNQSEHEQTKNNAASSLPSNMHQDFQFQISEYFWSPTMPKIFHESGRNFLQLNFELKVKAQYQTCQNYYSRVYFN